MLTRLFFILVLVSQCSFATGAVPKSASEILNLLDILLAIPDLTEPEVNVAKEINTFIQANRELLVEGTKRPVTAQEGREHLRKIDVFSEKLKSITEIARPYPRLNGIVETNVNAMIRAFTEQKKATELIYCMETGKRRIVEFNRAVEDSHRKVAFVMPSVTINDFYKNLFPKINTQIFQNFRNKEYSEEECFDDFGIAIERTAEAVLMKRNVP